LNKQIASDLNVMQFKNEQLQSEIEDLTDMNNKMSTQVIYQFDLCKEVACCS
jgi:hypothetical protein